MSEGSPQLESENISVDGEGGISMKVGEDMVKIGTIPVFTAIGDKAFIPQGNSHFVPSADAQITQSTNYDIKQGFLEGSTVDSAQVFSDIILTQRAFQLSSKAITTADDIWGMVNNMR